MFIPSLPNMGAISAVVFCLGAYPAFATGGKGAQKVLSPPPTQTQPQAEASTTCVTVPEQSRNRQGELSARQQPPINKKKWQKLLDLGRSEDDLPGLSTFLEEFAHHLTDLDYDANRAEALHRTDLDQPIRVKEFIVKRALRKVAARIGESEHFHNPDIVMQLLERYPHNLSERELATCVQKLAQDARVPLRALCHILGKHTLAHTPLPPAQQALVDTIIKPELEQADAPDQLLPLLVECGHWLSESELCAYMDRCQLTAEELIRRLHDYSRTSSALENIRITSLLFLACRQGLARASTLADKQNILACWVEHSQPREHARALGLVYEHLGPDHAWSRFEQMKAELEQQVYPFDNGLYAQAQRLWPDKVELYTDLIALIAKHRWYGFKRRVARPIAPQQYAFETCLKGLRWCGDDLAKSRSVAESWLQVAELDQHPEYLTQMWEVFGERLTQAGVNRPMGKEAGPQETAAEL